MNRDVYRLNVRFDLQNNEEAKAVQFLQNLSSADRKSRNRFIVNAVMEKIRQQGKAYDFSLEDIRQVFKEEIQGLSVAVPVTLPAEKDEEQKAANASSVLSALEMFD